jgi:hypothetical protein
MTRTITTALAAAACALLAGCEYTARQDTVTPWSGNAVAQNAALQMIDPWPRHAYDANIPTNGERQAGAYRKYATAHDKDDAPTEIAPVQLVVPQQN